MSSRKYGNSPLAMLMYERGLTQSDLSRRCGVSQATLSRFLGGGRGINVTSLMKIASFLSIDMETLCAHLEGVNPSLLHRSTT